MYTQRKTLFTSNACNCLARSTETRSTSRGAVVVVVVVAVACVSSEELLLLSRTRIVDTEEPNESDELTLVWDERLMMRRRLVLDRWKSFTCLRCSLLPSTSLVSMTITVWRSCFFPVKGVQCSLL